MRSRVRHTLMGTHHTSRPLSDLVHDAHRMLESVDGAADWPVADRLTAFHFMLLDAWEAEGLSGTDFNREASGFFSPYHEALREALAHVAVAPDVPGVNRFVADTSAVRFVTAEIMVQLLSTALADTSEGRERSAALADRALAWVASLFTSPVPGRTVDLVRYAVEAGYLPLDRIPGISDWFRPAGERGEAHAAD